MDDNDAYEALSSNIQLIDVDRGTTLFSEGEEGDLFYIIIQGEAEVLKASQLVVEYEGASGRRIDGDELVATVLEHALLTSNASSATPTRT